MPYAEQSLRVFHEAYAVDSALLKSIFQGFQSPYQSVVQRLLDSISVPVFGKDTDGRYRFCNAAFLTLLGHKRENIIGKTAAEIAPSDLAKIYHQQDIDLAKEGGVQVYETQVEDAHGVRRDFVFNKTAVAEADGALIGIVGVMLDVSEKNSFRDQLKMRTEELQRHIKDIVEAEERFRATFEQAAVGICHVALDGSFLRLNDRVCAFWGYSREELLKLTFQDITVDDDLEPDLSNLNKLLAGEIPHYVMEKRYRRKDGEIVWARLTVALVRNDAEEPDYFISVVEDISDEHASAEQLQTLSRRLGKALDGIIEVLMRTQESRDPYTAGHERRVAELALAIGRMLGLDEEHLQNLSMGATIHDVGKLMLPSDLLTKPGALSKEEFALIKTHARQGYGVVESADLPASVADIVLHHHERFDGSGYPDGLAGEDISLEARIVAAADTVEAIVSHRPYRPARGIEVALDVVREGKGTLFDPAVVDALMAVYDKGVVDWCRKEA